MPLSLSHPCCSCSTRRAMRSSLMDGCSIDNESEGNQDHPKTPRSDLECFLGLPNRGSVSSQRLSAMKKVKIKKAAGDDGVNKCVVCIWRRFCPCCTLPRDVITTCCFPGPRKIGNDYIKLKCIIQRWINESEIKTRCDAVPLVLYMESSLKTMSAVSALLK